MTLLHATQTCSQWLCNDSVQALAVLELMYVTQTAYSCMWAVMWVAWKSSGNGMMLVHRYVYAVYRVSSEYSEVGWHGR